MSREPTYPEQHDTLEGVPAPAENARLVGHADAAALLAEAHRTAKLPHALLITGPRGIGKATFAFHFANYLFSHPKGAEAPSTFGSIDPNSMAFRLVAGAAHPSLLHLTRPAADGGKGFKSVLSVDEVRKVGRFLSLTAHDGGWRVIIVDPADDMNRAAANALLKNLEEPPARTVFVLIAHAPGALLPTIRSRCQVIRLHPLEPDDVIQVVGSLGIQMPREEAERRALTEASGGSPRSAILISEYGGADIAAAIGTLASGRVDVAQAHKLADAVSARESRIALDLFNRQVLGLLADAAAKAADADDLARANSLAETWQAASNAITETEAYNLDRKLHALTMIERLNAAMRM